VWETATGKLQHRRSGHTSSVRSVTFSPDGQWLASASSDQTIRVSDAASGQHLLTLKGHAGEVLGLAFSPDGSRLASASAEVKLWTPTLGQESRQVRCRGTLVGRLAYSLDGTMLASTAPRDRTVSIWDVKTGQAIHNFEYELTKPPSDLTAGL